LDDADCEAENRINPPLTAPNPWYWSHNESADNPALPSPNPLSDEEYERILRCYERNKFSTLGSIVPYGQETLEVLETGSLISLGLDGIASGRKALGPNTASPNKYASGINMVSKDLNRGLGFPKIGNSPLGKYLTPIGTKLTPPLAVFGVFSLTYNTTVDIQCRCEILK
jgi:hypothetical protein